MCTPCSRPWDSPTLIRSNWVHTTSLPREIWRVGKARGNLQRLSTRGQSRLRDCKLNRVAVHAVWLIVVSTLLHTEERLVTGRAATLPRFFPLPLLHYRIVCKELHPSCLSQFHACFFLYCCSCTCTELESVGMVESF
jgi:hypothetical protein